MKRVATALSGLTSLQSFTSSFLPRARQGIVLVAIPAVLLALGVGPTYGQRNVYTTSSDNEVHKLDDNGNRLWRYTGHSNWIWDVTVDANGSIYTASRDEEAHKLDSSGNRLWKYTAYSAWVWDTAVDADGNVYTGSRSFDNDLRKLDSSGNLLWKYTRNYNDLLGVAVDADGNVYTAWEDNQVHKLDSSGSLSWAYAGHSDRVHNVAVDADGHVYTASADNEVHKLDRFGSQVWKYTGHSRSVRDIAVDAEGYVYTASNDDEVHKLDSNGNRLWTYTGHTSYVRGVAVDTDGNVYTAAADHEVHKLDSSGNRLWRYTGHSDQVHGVTVDPGAFATSQPPVLSSATTADTDGNGQIDEITVQFSEAVDVTDGNASDALPGYTVSGYTIADADYGASGVRSLTLRLVESGSDDTGATPAVTYARSTSNNPTVADVDGLEQADGDSVTPIDGASPVISSVTLGNDGANNLDFSFLASEQLDTGTSSIEVTVDGPSSGTDWQTFTDADFSETDNGGSFTYALSVDQGYNDGDGSYTASVDDAIDPGGNNGGNTGSGSGLTGSHSFTPPGISNVALGKDGSGNLTLSFDSDEQLGTSASDVAVTVNGPKTADVYSFDRSNFSESGTGPYTYALATTQAYDDGTGTYTASVDDALDSENNNGGNNGSGSSLTAPFTLTADVALTDGRDGASYSPPSPTPGTDSNPIGRFKLTANVSGSALSSITITQTASTPTGVDAIELWRSADNTFEAGNDTELASKGYADQVSFSVSPSIPTSGRHLFVVIDLASDASGDYDPKIANESDVSFSEGALSSVNGSSTTSFTDAYLSASSTRLPVELVRFEATHTKDRVTLTWRTASEQNNTGFRVQRLTDQETWHRVGWVDGNGTRARPSTYRFADTDLPYAADTLRYRLVQVDNDGTRAHSKPVAIARSAPNEMALRAPSPNPIRSRATLRYALPEAAEVRIALYDVMGRRVQTVTEGRQESGRKQIQINGSDLTSGVYFLRFRADEHVQTQRITVVR